MVIPEYLLVTLFHKDPHFGIFLSPPFFFFWFSFASPNSPHIFSQHSVSAFTLFNFHFLLSDLCPSCTYDVRLIPTISLLGVRIGDGWEPFFFWNFVHASVISASVFESGKNRSWLKISVKFLDFFSVLSFSLGRKIR